MTLSDLTGPLAAAAGVGALWGTAHENHESTPWCSGCSSWAAWLPGWL